MDSDLLRAFVAVADTGGFTAAARLLNRTQSAVSLQIKRLETLYGTQLFTRDSRRVGLTASGTRMLPYARRMLLLEQDAQAVLRHDGAVTTLRLGLTEEHAAAYLPQILAAMADACPDVRIEISCQISSVLVRRFDAGELDVVLAVRHQPTRIGRLLGVERMIWVGRESIALAADGRLPLALNPEGCIFREHALAALGRAARTWRETYVSASPSGVNAAVRCGLAMTIKTPRSMPADCCDVGARFDLPQLGLAEIEIHVSPARIGDAFDRLVSEVEAACRSGMERFSAPVARRAPPAP